MMQINQEAIISKQGNNISIEIDGYPNIQLVHQEYYDFSDVDFDDFFEVHHINNIIYKIYQDGQELKKGNSNILVEKIVKNDKNYVIENHSITIPSDYDFTSCNLDIPFLIILQKKSIAKILQANQEIGKFDYNKEVYSKLITWSSEAKFKKFYTEKVETILNKDEDSLFEFSFNYKHIPLNMKNIFSEKRLPADTLQIINGSDNFSLELNKLAPIIKTKDKQSFKIDVKKYDGWNKYGDLDFKKLQERHLSNAKAVTEGCLKVKNFKPDWRVVVGLGTDSVYETGITLHHIYGFPYIPASAIKGITNHYVLDLIKEAKEKKESYQDIENQYNIVFGNTKQQGKITFFDAMPLTAPKLKPDIMNVHYPDYYGGTSAPTDTQSPRPILFLTVEETEFQFMLGCKEDDKNLLETALKWLEKALQDKGIGAKTAVGYGYMNESCA